MRETSGRRLVATILFAIAVLASDRATPLDGATPIVEGTIVSRDSVGVGIPATFV